jgi:hypothetical protein
MKCGQKGEFYEREQSIAERDRKIFEGSICISHSTFDYEWGGVLHGYRKWRGYQCIYRDLFRGSGISVF